MSAMNAVSASMSESSPPYSARSVPTEVASPSKKAISMPTCQQVLVPMIVLVISIRAALSTLLLGVVDETSVTTLEELLSCLYVTMILLLVEMRCNLFSTQKRQRSTADNSSSTSETGSLENSRWNLAAISMCF
eukprot:gnl/TRDRNA2_/TRDRNA2_186590_c0_seq1.p1 gnl/TRDRNA2_/TRDRNA2_186590_c0~~gnl/TRDRNA2_/TRDRNA2_186590_c0_seq1.p1  ORF type:complete len:134 (-),score=20.42 gnl/TRDRNA2_/TRDRNA2_186590_c0_seq1:60-461(-)